jgi:hypothetical protein
MEKLRDSPPISVDGVPLVPYLRRVREEEFSGEIRNIIFLEELGEMALSRKRVSPKVIRRRRALRRGPAKRLDDDQVREEYGIMQKPYEMPVKNVIWLLKKHPTLTPAKIAAELDMNKVYAGQVVRKLLIRVGWRAFGETEALLVRTPLKKTHRYKLTDIGRTLEVEEIYAAYKGGTLPANLAPVSSEEVRPLAPDAETEIHPPSLEASALEGLVERGLRIVISGRVEVVFRFGR